MGSRTSTEEEVKVTDPKNGGTKTLGIKLPDSVHAQLTLIASLDGQPLTDAIREAIDLYIEHKRGAGDMAERAARALEEVEREAALRRGALEALFGPQQPAADTTEPAKPAPRRRGEPTS
jgi:predicted DNA-binding protein